MIGETNNPGDKDEDDDTVSDAISDGEIIADTEDDNVGDISVEINVEELVAKIESIDDDEAAEKGKVRKKLEEIREKHEDELDGTYNFNLDDDDV